MISDMLVTKVSNTSNKLMISETLVYTRKLVVSRFHCGKDRSGFVV